MREVCEGGEKGRSKRGRRYEKQKQNTHKGNTTTRRYVVTRGPTRKPRLYPGRQYHCVSLPQVPLAVQPVMSEGSSPRWKRRPGQPSQALSRDPSGSLRSAERKMASIENTTRPNREPPVLRDGYAHIDVHSCDTRDTPCCVLCVVCH